LLAPGTLWQLSAPLSLVHMAADPAPWERLSRPADAESGRRKPYTAKGIRLPLR